MKKSIVTSLLMALMLGVQIICLPISTPSAVRDTAATPIQTADQELAAEYQNQSAPAKLAVDMAYGQTCRSVAGDIAQSEPATAAKFGRAGKRITVSSLVERALADQTKLLLARQSELERWDGAAQRHFAKWFGTTNSQARSLIYERLRVLTLLNKEYSVGNFRRAVPSKPGLFAFVRPTDPSRIFVDQAFVFAPKIGANSRAGTITHEMSHFVLAGGTRDFTYGTNNCRSLARLAPGKALRNADNFEFYVENVP